MPNYLRRVLVVLSAFAWLGLPAPGWAQKGTIKIAVQAPLSGEQAALGEHIKLGAQLAVEEAVNGAGGGQEILADGEIHRTF